MLEYVTHIIVPYVERVIGDLEEKATLVIMDNFKGQVTDAVRNLLEEHDIYVSLLPANTTDRLQPMDIGVNKPTKDFIKRQVNEWYVEGVIKQLHGKNMEKLEESQLEPINLSMPVVKNVGASGDGLVCTCK